MKIAVLALQGAFIEHEKKLEQLGATCIELRQKSDLDQDFDGLVLPGGESTVQGKLLKELDMFDDLQKRIQDGLPTLATCAGLILLAKEIENQNQTYFSTIPMMVKRNAYGRQLGSFHTMGTELTKNSLSTNPHEEAMLKEHVIPMKKLATTQEVVNAVLWLSSEEASHTTGQKIFIDGGMHIA